MKELLPVEYVDPRTLREHPDNPAVHAHKQAVAISQSIESFGWVAPVVVSRASGIIVDGHARVEEALSQEFPTVPVRYLDLTPAEEKKALLAFNRTSELRGMDEERLVAVLTALAEETGDFAPGYDAEDFEARIESLKAHLDAGEEASAAEEDTALAPLGETEEVETAPPRCAAGEVWALGEHRLLVDDCRDLAAVARLMRGARVNMVFTSPPYAAQRRYDTESEYRPVEPEAYGGWWKDVQRPLALYLAEDGSYFLNIKEHTSGGQRHLYVKELILAHVRQWGWRFVDELVWIRQGWPGKYEGRFKNQFEPVFHFSLTPHIKFNPDAVRTEGVTPVVPSGERPAHRPVSVASSFYTMNIGAGSEDGTVLPGNVLYFPQGGSAAAAGHEHPAVFPPALPTFFIRAFTDPGDTVYDPFLGSGTVLLACEKEGRRGFGADVSSKYCDLVIARWEKLTGREAKRL